MEADQKARVAGEGAWRHWPLRIGETLTNRTGEGLGFTGAIVAQMTCERGGVICALNGDPGGGRVVAAYA